VLLALSQDQALYVLPTTRAALIANELRRRIVTGELKPGDRLRQGETAARFGASTTPVREAFTALAREGLVQQDAHRGVVVFTPQIEDLIGNYEIRGVLEPLAIELALHELTEDQLDELDSLIASMAQEPDRSRYHELNREFHAKVYQAANRPRLAKLIDSLRDSTDGYLRLNAAQPGNDGYQRQVHVQHEAIAKALRERDVHKARNAVTEHLAHNRKRLEDLVKVLGR